MKKMVVLTCVIMLLAGAFSGCSGSVCEHCGEPAMMLNQVGDNVDGIAVCDNCIEKMRMSKIRFNFTCDECNQDKLGKKNKVVVGSETKTVCNTCFGKMQ